MGFLYFVVSQPKNHELLESADVDLGTIFFCNCLTDSQSQMPQMKTSCCGLGAFQAILKNSNKKNGENFDISYQNFSKFDRILSVQ